MATRGVLGWNGWAVSPAYRSANVVVMGGTPESAVMRAMERAAQKYGEDQDWSAWQFRAEPVPRGSGDVVRSAWRDGAFVRL
jgi:hypothetical protein